MRHLDIHVFRRLPLTGRPDSRGDKNVRWFTMSSSDILTKQWRWRPFSTQGCWEGHFNDGAEDTDWAYFQPVAWPSLVCFHAKVRSSIKRMNILALSINFLHFILLVVIFGLLNRYSDSSRESPSRRSYPVDHPSADSVSNIPVDDAIIKQDLQVRHVPMLGGSTAACLEISRNKELSCYNIRYNFTKQLIWMYLVPAIKTNLHLPLCIIFSTFRNKFFNLVHLFPSDGLLLRYCELGHPSYILD